MQRYGLAPLERVAVTSPPEGAAPDPVEPPTTGAPDAGPSPEPAAPPTGDTPEPAEGPAGGDPEGETDAPEPDSGGASPDGMYSAVGIFARPFEETVPKPLLTSTQNSCLTRTHVS